MVNLASRDNLFRCNEVKRAQKPQKRRIPLPSPIPFPVNKFHSQYSKSNLPGPEMENPSSHFIPSLHYRNQHRVLTEHVMLKTNFGIELLPEILHIGFTYQSKDYTEISGQSNK